MTAEQEEQLAYVWTLRSEARVGSYQHEVSSLPWRVLGGEEMYLRHMLERGDHHQHTDRG